MQVHNMTDKRVFGVQTRGIREPPKNVRNTASRQLIVNQ